MMGINERNIDEKFQNMVDRVLALENKVKELENKLETKSREIEYCNDSLEKFKWEIKG